PLHRVHCCSFRNPMGGMYRRKSTELACSRTLRLGCTSPDRAAIQRSVVSCPDKSVSVLRIVDASSANATVLHPTGPGRAAPREHVRIARGITSGGFKRKPLRDRPPGRGDATTTLRLT